MHTVKSVVTPANAETDINSTKTNITMNPPVDSAKSENIIFGLKPEVVVSINCSRRQRGRKVDTNIALEQEESDNSAQRSKNRKRSQPLAVTQSIAKAARTNEKKLQKYEKPKI